MRPTTRREFLFAAGVAGAALALDGAPARAQKRELSFLSTNHFVPASDDELRRQAELFGKQAGLTMRVDTIQGLQLPAKRAAEAQSQSGHDLIFLTAADPFLFESLLVDVAPTVDTLGKKSRKEGTMARGGYRIFDADTHIIEPVEPIEAYLSAADRAKLTALGSIVQRAPAKAGMSRYVIGKRPKLNRRLGSHERVDPPSSVARGVKDGGTPWDVRWQGPPFPTDRVSFDPHERVRDMDIEGIDVNMVLPSGGVPGFCGVEDVALEAAMYQAYHRFLKEYCAPYPERLTSLVLVSARDVAAAVAEIRRCSLEDWPVGIFPLCPPEMSLDDPAWEPIWAAAQEHDLTVVIHSFTMTVPYPPGMWDTWDNVFLQRAAGHVWNAQRNMAALIGAGVLDRYPQLRLTSLECGHGWLAFWASRLDELAEMSRHALPPLKQKPSAYIRGPQYFQSIQLHEGEQALRHALEALGEDTLMFATDYPHSESWFPKSVEVVLGWTSIAEQARRKLLWDNALRCYHRYAARAAVTAA